MLCIISAKERAKSALCWQIGTRSVGRRRDTARAQMAPLSAGNTRRLNKLLRRRPNLSIKMINRLLRIATPRLRVMLGHLFQYFASPTCPEGGWLLEGPEWPFAKYTAIFLRRGPQPIRDSDVVKSLALRVGPTSKPSKVKIPDEGATALTAEEQLARGYQQQISAAEKASHEPGGDRPSDTCIRLQSVIDVDITLQPDSYDMRFRGEGCWPTLGTLRLDRLTVSAEAQLKWDVRGGKLWLYFREGAPLSVEASYSMIFLGCDVFRFLGCFGPGLVPGLLRWWLSTCTEDDPLEIDLGDEHGELEREIHDEHETAAPPPGAEASAAAPPPAAEASAAGFRTVVDAEMLAEFEAHHALVHAAAARLQARQRGSVCRRELSEQGVAVVQHQQTPAAFRQQRKGLREVLTGRKAKPVEPPKPPKAKREQSVKIEAMQGRQQGVGLPNR